MIRRRSRMPELSSFELDALQSVNDEVKAMIRKSDELLASVKQKLSDIDRLEDRARTRLVKKQVTFVKSRLEPTTPELYDDQMDAIAQQIARRS
jgi:hypothetical protein